MKYAVEQRLRMIDFLLASYGHINRSMLIDYFGISQPSATRDFKEYMQLSPGSMVYDINNKTYHASTTFKRMYL